MNATEMTSQKNMPCLNRIKSVSATIRVIFILLLAFYSAIFLIYWFGAVHDLNHDNVPLNGGMIFEWLVFMVRELGKIAQLWMAYKLFTGFNAGDWFSTNSMSWLRRIGFTSMIIWLMGLLGTMPLAWNQLGFDHIHYLPAMEQLRQYVGFATNCVRLNSDLLTGFLLFFIAWIVDEGRKMREEQELTV